METMIETSSCVFKVKKMFWFERETSEIERDYGYPPKVREALLFGLKNDNSAWYAYGCFWNLRTGHYTENRAYFTLERMAENMQRSSEFIEAKSLMTDEEWVAACEADRKKHNGTWLDEGTVPPMIPNFGVS